MRKLEIDQPCGKQRETLLPTTCSVGFGCRRKFHHNVVETRSRSGFGGGHGRMMYEDSGEWRGPVVYLTVLMKAWF
jgi:hypothetical protein